MVNAKHLRIIQWLLSLPEPAAFSSTVARDAYTIAQSKPTHLIRSALCTSARHSLDMTAIFMASGEAERVRFSANASYIGCVVSLRLVIHQSTPLDLTDASLATLSLLRASVCTSVIRSRLRPSSCLFLR
jgi:hypothetical protein